MNNDLISRSALKKAILEHCRSEIEAINHFWYDDTIISLINNAPTVTPEKAKEGELVKAYTKGFDTGKETMNEELALQYTKGYQAGFLEAKKLHGETEGEWLDNIFIGGYVCNNCNAGYSSNPKSAFCPICGARMKNGQVPEVLARREQSKTNGGQPHE